jgi:L-asparaginase II
MSNPILVEVTRGEFVESIHRGSVAVADAEGTIRFCRGDVQSAICPRSGLKPLQSLVLVESGAADAFALGSEEIALASASHTGEAMHVTAISAWLEKIGCREDDLACGPQAPCNREAFADMIRQGAAPTRLHNGCSGKHAGFLTVAQHWNAGTVSYIHTEHPVQKAVAETVMRLSGVEHLPHVVDGCTAPNFCLSLTGFARALAKMAGGASPGAARVVQAMIAHPELVAGTGTVCTNLIRACAGKAAVKSGSEGVYAAILPGSGLGVALKIDDGAMRAAETAMAAVLIGLGIAGDGAKPYARPAVVNSRGVAVGERRPAAALSKADLMTI